MARGDRRSAAAREKRQARGRERSRSRKAREIEAIREDLKVKLEDGAVSRANAGNAGSNGGANASTGSGNGNSAATASSASNPPAGQRAAKREADGEGK